MYECSLVTDEVTVAGPVTLRADDADRSASESQYSWSSPLMIPSRTFSVNCSPSFGQ